MLDFATVRNLDHASVGVCVGGFAGRFDSKLASWLSSLLQEVKFRGHCFEDLCFAHFLVLNFVVWCFKLCSLSFLPRFWSCIFRFRWLSLLWIWVWICSPQLILILSCLLIKSYSSTFNCFGGHPRHSCDHHADLCPKESDWLVSWLVDVGWSGLVARLHFS